MVRSQAEDILRGFFAKDPHGASAVYLFGSVARGTSRPTSDVDIGCCSLSHPRDSAA